MKLNSPLALNGAGSNYVHSIASFTPASPAARICTGLRDLMKLKGKISDDRLKILLDGYARGVIITKAPDVTGERDQKWVRTAFSVAFQKLYTPKAVELMLKKDAKSHTLADVLAAFGGAENGESKVSDQLKPTFLAASGWNDDSIAEFAR